MTPEQTIPPDFNAPPFLPNDDFENLTGNRTFICSEPFVPVVPGVDARLGIVVTVEKRPIGHGNFSHSTLWRGRDPERCVFYWGVGDKKDTIRFFIGESKADEYVEIKFRHIRKIQKLAWACPMPTTLTCIRIYLKKHYHRPQGYLDVGICNDTLEAWLQYYHKRQVVKNYYLSAML